MFLPDFELRGLIVAYLRSVQSGLYFASAWTTFVVKLGTGVRVTFLTHSVSVTNFERSSARTGKMTLN